MCFGLPLGLEAPVMMPNGVFFLFFLSKMHVHVQLGNCSHKLWQEACTMYLYSQLISLQ